MNESTVTDILPLTRLGIYNPQRLNDNEVELSFVARQLLFKYIFGYIIDERSGSIPQHHLIIGQRGMGKSTLLKRMEVELRKSPHCERLIPILFPEEQYNIDRLSKFWLNCLDALADTFEVEHKTEEAEALDEQIKALIQNRHEGSLSQDAFGLFLKCKNLIIKSLHLRIFALNPPFIIYAFLIHTYHTPEVCSKFVFQHCKHSQIYEIR